MSKKAISSVGSCTAIVLRFLFVLFAVPIIHLHELDNVDSCLIPEEINKPRKIVKSLKREKNEYVR